MSVIVRPTKADKKIARIIARNINPATEKTAEILTWGADEHTLCVAAAIWWLYCRGRPTIERAGSNHILITAIATTILPHLMKHIFAQERPDRRSVEAHLHGAPFSGRPLQSFLSGHAVYVGALASAASQLPTTQRHSRLDRGHGFGSHPGFSACALGKRRCSRSRVRSRARACIIRLFTGFGYRRDA
jgi:hypothetical protein